MLKISKKIFDYILNADDKTDLYCIVPGNQDIPTANDIRVMSGYLKLEVRLTENRNPDIRLRNVWEYYLHVLSVPITEHNHVKVFTSAEERDAELVATLGKYKEKMADNERMLGRLENLLTGEQ